jgi:hypothetical protein
MLNNKRNKVKNFKWNVSSKFTTNDKNFIRKKIIPLTNESVFN